MIIYKYRKISQDTGLSYGVVKAWHDNATVLKQLVAYYSYRRGRILAIT